jgi:hypothetical protein
MLERYSIRAFRRHPATAAVPLDLAGVASW